MLNRFFVGKKILSASNLILLFVAALSLSSNAISQFDPPPDAPDFESSFIEYDNIIYGGSEGFITMEGAFINGSRIVTRYRFVTKSGHEALIVAPSNPDYISIYTPGGDLQVRRISDTRAIITNLVNGQSREYDAPADGWPDVELSQLPSPTDQWQHELLSLVQAAEFEANQPTAQYAHPLDKYVTGGSIQTDFGPLTDSCTVVGCGLNSFLTLAGAYSTASVCMAAITVSVATGDDSGSGLGLGFLCAAGYIGTSLSFAAALEGCPCAFTEEPEIGPETEIVEETLPCGAECRNFLGSPPPSAFGFNFGCVEVLVTTVTYPDGTSMITGLECVKYGYY